MLSYQDNCYDDKILSLPDYLQNNQMMLEEGFEPSKRVASDLKSLPFDQTREP